MIYSYSIEKSSICIKKDIAKQTGFTKLTMTGLKTMQFFRKYVYAIWQFNSFWCQFNYALQHNFDYVVFLFIVVKALIFEFACGVFHLFPQCIYVWCLRLNVRECLQVLQCLFEVCKKCVRKDALNYVETLYSLILLHFRKVLSSFSILYFCQAVFLFL